MVDVAITKRLHISGLTPAITADELSKRLSTFGSVKSVDGIGLLDGVGAPRKFGYVTIETTVGKLARCMNLLSGATWKGSKLRLGEAKPDYATRIAAENTADPQARPKKRRKVHGEYSNDMSLVTPENAASRGGWKVTPLGRTMRPVKMRPWKPLPPPLEEKATKRALKERVYTGEEKKKKKKVKEPDSRARRKAIDMTKWGSTHLKGIFLESQGMVGAKKVVGESLGDESADESSDEGDDQMNVVDHGSLDETQGPSPIPPVMAVKASKRPTLPTFPSVKATSIHSTFPDNNTDIALEKSQSLTLLASFFGDKHNSEWVGRESAGSDVDEEALLRGSAKFVDGYEDDFEVVPLSNCPPPPSPVGIVEGGNVKEAEKVVKPSKKETKPSSKLKELFAPRDEDAGFSLLGHLDLESELDDETPFPIAQQAPHTQQDVATHSQPSFLRDLPAVTNATQHPITSINPKQALFFPLPATTANKVRQRDVFDVIKDNKWYWRDPAVGFYRTGTEDEIRKEWEEKKGDLTVDWKRRAREAGKVNRRRRVGVDADGE